MAKMGTGNRVPNDPQFSNIMGREPALRPSAWIERTGAQLLGPCGHLSCNLREARSLGGGEIVHLHPVALHTDGFKGAFHIFDFAAGFDISFQEMAFTLQSPRHIDGVGTVLDGP